MMVEVEGLLWVCVHSIDPTLPPMRIGLHQNSKVSSTKVHRNSKAHRN